MLNSIAGLLVAQLLRYDAFQRPGSNEPISPEISRNAQLPGMSPYKIDAGVVIALLAAVFVWWYLERSTWGFELRAVGANPNAARTAGMSIGKVTALTMTLSGALCGLAGGVTITGDIKYLTANFDGTLGFDAITVALLGRNRPLGTVMAGPSAPGGARWRSRPRSPSTWSSSSRPSSSCSSRPRPWSGGCSGFPSPTERACAASSPEM